MSMDRSNGYPGSRAAAVSARRQPNLTGPAVARQKPGRGAAVAHRGADPHGHSTRVTGTAASIFDRRPWPVDVPEAWEADAVNLTALKETDPAAANRAWRRLKAEDPQLAARLQTDMPAMAAAFGRVCLHVPREYAYPDEAGGR